MMLLVVNYFVTKSNCEGCDAEKVASLFAHALTEQNLGSLFYILPYFSFQFFFSCIRCLLIIPNKATVNKTLQNIVKIISLNRNFEWQVAHQTWH